MRNQEQNNFLIRNFGIAAGILLAVGVLFYFSGFSLIIPLLLLILGVHLYFFKKATVRLFLQLGLLFALLLTGTHALVEYTTVPVLYIPVAAIALLTMLLYNDLQLAFLMSFISSVSVALIVDGNIDLMLTFLVGSLVAAYTVKGARTRGAMINAGLFIGLIQVFSVILLNGNMQFVLTKGFAFHYFRPLVINGFVSAFVVIATLKIFESLFGVLTNFSLLELSDFNHPLLKRMILEAPGTYHHSLIVSNLAETAADTIGANALLTRVGAYYHDIGKMIKPEYFTENQLTEGNKHDQLEPSMSRLVILNHIKEGVELAQKYKLNPKIIDFIPQHHGTGLLYYFYQKALEEAKEGENIREENFRYPGPKPQSKEAAVLMLADSVEGATRALDEHTPSKIDEVVRRIINNKFIDGQLDECDLTLKDIEMISTTFTRVLSAMYHGRVKYPEKKNGNTGKKSAEKSSDKNSPNQPDRPESSA